MELRGILRAGVAALGCCAVLVALSGCGGGGGGGGGGGAVLPIAPGAVAPPPTTAPAAGRTTSATIQSSKTGATYELQVYLPPSYDSSAAPLPIIYALDADAGFNPPGLRFQNLKEILERRGVEALLVGIGGTGRRSTDFNLPGVVPYHEFLTTELLPFIESKYRVNTGKRILTGLSLGGSMTGIALFLEGAGSTLAFSHFLSFDGAFGFQKADIDAMEQKMYDARSGKTFNATLFLARCGDTANCNYVQVGDLYDKLLKRAYPGLTLVEKTYSKSHLATDLPAFDDAMALIFK